MHIYSQALTLIAERHQKWPSNRYFYWWCCCLLSLLLLFLFYLFIIFVCRRMFLMHEAWHSEWFYKRMQHKQVILNVNIVNLFLNIILFAHSLRWWRCKMMIVEDNFIQRMLLAILLKKYIYYPTFYFFWLENSKKL